MHNNYKRLEKSYSRVYKNYAAILLIYYIVGAHNKRRVFYEVYTLFIYFYYILFRDVIFLNFSWIKTTIYYSRIPRIQFFIESCYYWTDGLRNLNI